MHIAYTEKSFTTLLYSFSYNTNNIIIQKRCIQIVCICILCNVHYTIYMYIEYMYSIYLFSNIFICTSYNIAHCLCTGCSVVRCMHQIVQWLHLQTYTCNCVTVQNCRSPRITSIGIGCTQSCQNIQNCLSPCSARDWIDYQTTTPIHLNTHAHCTCDCIENSTFLFLDIDRT